jgi:hypothetical protein
MMTIEPSERDIEDKMKFEPLSVLQLINKAVKIEKLLQSEIEIQWSKRELKSQKSLII